MTVTNTLSPPVRGKLIAPHEFSEGETLLVQDGPAHVVDVANYRRSFNVGDRADDGRVDVVAVEKVRALARREDMPKILRIRYLFGPPAPVRRRISGILHLLSSIKTAGKPPARSANPFAY
jgi:hypothetical protein